MKRQSPPPLTAQLDHLVVAAATLADGVRWCEKVLGVTPGPGGEHPLMGTHNRLLSIASPAFPLAYLEVIAIHAGAPCARSGALKRWFDLDDRELHAQLVSHGPQLIHFVARTAQATASVRALSAMGLDRGRLLQASRETGAGLLQWKIAVRDDGQRLFYGALPTICTRRSRCPMPACVCSRSTPHIHARWPCAPRMKRSACRTWRSNRARPNWRRNWRRRSAWSCCRHAASDARLSQPSSQRFKRRVRQTF